MAARGGVAVIWLLGALGWLKRAFSAALALVTRYPLQCALVASLALLVWTWHGRSKAIGQRDAAIAGRASDNAICRKSIDSLQAGIDDQNAAIAKLGADTIAKQKAAAIAVEAATARGKVSEGYAVRIDREPAVKGGPVCRSGAAVLDARNEL